MTENEDNGPPEELTHEEVIRLVEEAKARGEPTSPIMRRYVLQTIDRVIKYLETARDKAEPE